MKRVLLLLAALGVAVAGCGPVSPTTELATPSAGWLSRVQRELATREYRPSETRRGLQAPNRRHDLRTYFEPTGIRVVDRTAPGSPELVALSLSAVGRGEELRAVAPGVVSHQGDRVEIARDDGALVEWYVNSPEGLEQGMTLAKRPAGDGALELEINVVGAEVSLRADGLSFRSDAGRRLSYDKLHVEDAKRNQIAAHFAIVDLGFRIVVEDEGAVYPLVVDPLLTSSFDHEIESNQLGAVLGRGVASAGDVNGDGYADVIVGAYLYDAGQSDEGVALIFHGGPNGIGDGNPINADTLLESNQSGSLFGLSVDTAGDVNGDGYDDVIVGAYEYETAGAPTDEGAAWVFLGGPSGVADGNPATAHAEFHSNQASSTFGVDVAHAGDVNGDGYGDILIGAHLYDAGETDEGAAFVYLGSATGLADGTPLSAHAQFESDQAGAQLGFNLASAGDINADGYGDVILGAALHDGVFTEDGLALVFHGSATGVDPSTAHSSLSPAQAGARFGSSVAAAGDVNGDGYGDVIVGSYLADFGTVDEGAAFIFYGTQTGLFVAPNMLTSGQSGSQFGWSVASAGDVNGDGYGDVVVGAHGYDNPESSEGSAFVYLGGADGIPTGATAEWQLESNQAFAQLGVQVASAGDLNGDGFDDLIIGAYTMDGPQTDEGQAFIYHGGATGIGDGDPATAHAQLESNQASSFFGLSVASAGDVNGDGYADVIVGARGYDAGETDEGAAFVFLGSAAGIADGDPGTAHAQLESDQPGALLGYSVASAGDVNGDGYADVIVGASHYDAGETNEGAAFVFLGSVEGRLVRPQQLRGDGSGVPVQPWGAALDDDSFQVELDVTSPRGRERAKLEIEACRAGVAFGDLSCDSHVSSTWVDLGTTGASFSETISGLTEDELYHWRARGLYVPLRATEPGITPNPRTGPWRRIAGAGGNADIRMVPEPNGLLSLLAGVVLLGFLSRRGVEQCR